MDIWVVAAAAGAGYVARHCKNLVKGRQSFSDLSCKSPTIRTESSSITHWVKDNKSCPCSPGHSNRDNEDMCPEVERLSRVTSMAEKASSSLCVCQNHMPSSDCSDSSTCYGSNSVPGIPSYEDIQEIRVCSDVGERFRDDPVMPPTREIVAYGFKRKRSNLRSRRTNKQFLKPINSLESCLMAQLYKGQGEAEDYIYTSETPPCTPTVRPFPAAEGGKIIGSSGGQVVRNTLQMPTNAHDKRMILGVPQLPSIGFARKGKTQMKIEQGLTLCNSNVMEEKHQKMQGFSRGALLFCLGMSIGLASSVLNNKREVDHLSDLLKQTEGLVQDLQEELEMKDSLTVKELAVEDCESQDTQSEAFNNGPLHSYSPDEKLNDLIENNTQKAEEESFSKIEAELEAELERLELNINSSGLDREMPNHVELDTDNVAHAVAGELNADALGHLQSGHQQPYADRNGSGSSTPHSVHYTVSPRELTLRLHEVIQSRLEQRVEELEIALQNSQMKVRYMESKNASYLRELLNRRKSRSPVLLNKESLADQPVVINLSGEALDDDEYTKMNELDEDDVGNNILQREISRASSQEHKIYWRRHNELNDESFGEMLMLAGDKEQEEGDDDNRYDEMEELLIKHIVEKARKGSPVVLNAQRALSSPDENEHSQ